MQTHTPDANITWHAALVSQQERAAVLGQQGCVIWLTGLSGSGKSTIARALEKELLARDRAAYVLDGDNIRHGLNADLDFSPQSRKENIRRIGCLAALFADAGLITVTAFISPYRQDRDRARAIVAETVNMTDTTPFIEVFVNTPLDICEARDPKQLYQKARAGEISDFTGISAPYEPPLTPEIELPTAHQTIQQSVEQITSYLISTGIIPA